MPYPDSDTTSHSHPQDLAFSYSNIAAGSKVRHGCDVNNGSGIHGQNGNHVPPRIDESFTRCSIQEGCVINSNCNNGNAAYNPPTSFMEIPGTGHIWPGAPGPFPISPMPIMPYWPMPTMPQMPSMADMPYQQGGFQPFYQPYYVDLQPEVKKEKGGLKRIGERLKGKWQKLRFSKRKVGSEVANSEEEEETGQY